MIWVSRSLLLLAAGLIGCAPQERDEPEAEAQVPNPAGTTDPMPTSEGSSGPPPTTTGATPQPATTNPVDDDGPGGPIFDVSELPDAPPEAEECVQDVDIVFVMDVSTTMGTFLTTLADSILTIDAAVAEFDLPSEPHYGLVVFVDDAEIVNGAGPYTSAELLRDDFEWWGDFTSSNQQVGGGNSNTTWPENSLDALYIAATQFEWRPAESTTRLVIHTTDDTFWEGPGTHNGIMVERDYPETIEALQAETIRVFAVADTIGGSCSCLDVAPGWFEPYMDQPSIPDATDGGIFDINAVLGGTVSIADAITESVEESYCSPYEPEG